MTNDVYAMAYKEVLEIFKYIPVEEINKIPTDIIEMFEKNKDEEYNYKIDINKPFKEQKLLQETEAILANIFRDYWASPYQKQKIIEKENYDNSIIEKEKREKYNSDNLFNNQKNAELEESNVKNTNLPVEVKKDNFIIKIWNNIKCLLHKYL